MEQPRVGTHYPRSTGEFQAWFRTDADCLDYLDWVRWPGGFTCPSCGHAGGWRLGDGRYECAGCHGRTSVTAGTIFDRTRTPLTVWFTACWLFATQKDGISAQHLQRALETGSYPTAWAMLHRLRSVLVRPGRDRDRAGGRDVHRRGRAGAARRPGPGQEGAHRHRGGGPRAEGDRPVPDGGAGRWLGGIAAPVRDRRGRAGREGHHGRLDGLPRPGRARLRPPAAQPAGRPCPRG